VNETDSAQIVEAPEPVDKVHSVVFEMASGIDGWRMDCPFDLDDRTRNCWPCDEDGTPDDEGHCCTWTDWFENLHITECIDHAEAVRWTAAASWNGGAPSFELTAPVRLRGET
jgi:hypothetical protein